MWEASQATQEASRRHAEASRDTQEDTGGIQEEHRGNQETARRHPDGERLLDVSDQKYRNLSVSNLRRTVFSKTVL